MPSTPSFIARTRNFITAPLFALLCAVTPLAGCSGCSDDEHPPGQGSQDGGLDGAVVDGGDAGESPDGDAAIPDGSLPMGADCSRYGESCVASGSCCSGMCDPESSTCVSSIEHCTPEGSTCTVSTDCCNLSCRSDGRCGTEACVSDGQACEENADCCSQLCEGGSCVSLNTACKTAGNECGDSAQCCSGLCKDEKCQLAASFCVQQGDICSRAEDCCSARCTIPEGRSVGLCDAPPTGASFCTGGVEGSLCGDCNECCSRLCAPYTATGVKVCQPASGCHVTGDFCRTDGDCCGSAGTGLPGEGNVQCEKEPGADLGICRNPMSCSPQGNICHYKDYACGVSSARANCCGGLGAKGGVCQLDPLGVPRCNGLGDTCRAAGETCASADDCCEDRPCVPDAEGALRCAGEGDACVMDGGSCTINADCCTGTSCVRAIGSTQGTCVTNTPVDGNPPDGGTGDAGTSDAGTPLPPGACAQYGQGCESDGDCCNSVPCSDGICRSVLQ